MKGILPFPRSVAMDDCLQRERTSVWFGAVRKIENPVISTYLQGLLMTGARREELPALRREDVDFRWRSLTMNGKFEGAVGRASTDAVSSGSIGRPATRERDASQRASTCVACRTGRASGTFRMRVR